jgi:SAM-dependent methyltransferase
MNVKSGDRGGTWREPSAAERWLGRTDRLPRWAEAEAVVLTDVMGGRGGRVLDLGTGDGYMLATLRIAGRSAEGVGVDFSQPLLEAAARRFADDHNVRLIEHDLAHPLPLSLGEFDVVISALAIHHLEDRRKRELYAEAFALLKPGGVFCNIDIVAAPTSELHRRSQAALNLTVEDEHDDSPAPLEPQLEWLRAAGFSNVDCYWKWLELAVIAGERSAALGATVET